MKKQNSKISILLISAVFFTILSGCSKAKTAAAVATANSQTIAQYFAGNWLSSCVHVNNLDMKEYVNFDAAGNVAYEWYVYGSSGSTCTGNPSYKDPQFQDIADGTSPVAAAAYSVLDVSGVPDQFLPGMLTGGASTIIELWYIVSGNQFNVISLNSYSSSLGSTWSDWSKDADVTAFLAAPTSPSLSKNAFFFEFKKQ